MLSGQEIIYITVFFDKQPFISDVLQIRWILSEYFIVNYILTKKCQSGFKCHTKYGHSLISTRSRLHHWIQIASKHFYRQDLLWKLIKIRNMGIFGFLLLFLLYLFNRCHFCLVNHWLDFERKREETEREKRNNMKFIFM